MQRKLIQKKQKITEMIQDSLDMPTVIKEEEKNKRAEKKTMKNEKIKKIKYSSRRRFIRL